MIIVGWGHQKTKNLGPVERRVCPNCKNEDFWELHRIGTYATFFFVPIIPYKTEHFLMCPICRAALEVEGAQIEQCKAMAEQNLARIRGS